MRPTLSSMLAPVDTIKRSNPIDQTSGRINIKPNSKYQNRRLTFFNEVSHMFIASFNESLTSIFTRWDSSIRIKIWDVFTIYTIYTIWYETMLLNLPRLNLKLAIIAS